MTDYIHSDERSTQNTPSDQGPEPTGDHPRLTYLVWRPQAVEEKDSHEVFTALRERSSDSVHWVNVLGLDPPLIARLGSLIGLHAMAIEDLVNPKQRPILEAMAEYLYLVVKAPDIAGDGHSLRQEQIGIVLSKGLVISLQEREPDIFEDVAHKLRADRFSEEQIGADVLAYWLVDAVVDHYFAVLEDVGAKIEDLEERVLTQASPATLDELHRLKRDMILLRKSVWPLREVIGGLERDGAELIRAPLRVYLRDLYDHTIQVMDSIESNRDMISGLFDIYLSSISNRTNEIMKVLTVISTLFIPLTFLTSVYGMNFKYMPELSWRWSYPLLWAFVVAALVAMVHQFRRRGWL